MSRSGSWNRSFDWEAGGGRREQLRARELSDETEEDPNHAIAQPDFLGCGGFPNQPQAATEFEMTPEFGDRAKRDAQAAQELRRRS